VSEGSTTSGIIFIVSIALFCDFVLLTIIVPYLPYYLTTLGVDQSSVGLLFSSKAIVQNFVNPIIGAATHQIGSQRMLAWGLAVLCGSTITYACNGTHFAVLVAARAVQGAASAAIICGGMSWIAETHPSSKRGPACGKALGIGALGVLVGLALGGIIFQLYGYAAPFFTAVGMIVCALLGMLAVSARQTSESHQGDEGPESDGEVPSICALLHQPVVWLVFANMMAANASVAMLEPVLQLYMDATFAMDTVQRSLVWLALPVCYTTFTPVAGYLSDRMSKWAIIACGELLLAAGCVGFASCRSIPVVIMSMLVSGVGIRPVDAPVNALMSDIADENGYPYGIGFAITDVASSLGFIIGPIGGTALLRVTSASLCGLIFGGSCAVVGCGCLVQAPRAKAATPTEKEKGPPKGLPRGAIEAVGDATAL
jgi:MFS family permease